MADKPKKDDNAAHEPLPDFTFANRISTGTLVRLLIRKGILSIEELVKEERQAKEFREQLGKKPDSFHLISHHRHNQSRFKRFTARHKWARKLTSFLFGWEWKKHYRK